MADLNALGRELRRHLGVSIGWTLFGTVFCLLIGGLLIAVPLVNGLAQVAAFGSSRIDDVFDTEDFWVPVVFGVGALILAVVIGVGAILSKSRAIAVHENGLAFYKGRVLETTIDWPAVYALTRTQRYSVQQRTTHVTFTLHASQKRTFSFTQSIGQHEALVAECQRRIDANVGAAYAERIRAGQKASFGAVSLDSTAVYLSDFPIPWPEVRGIQVSGSAVVIQRRHISADAPQSVSLDRVPNWWILERLGREHIQ